MSNGSGWGDLDPWMEVAKVAALQENDLLLQTSVVNAEQCKNVVRVLFIRDDGRGEGFYGIFVDPDDHDKVRMPGDRRFHVWEHDLGKGEYYRPHPTRRARSANAETAHP